MKPNPAETQILCDELLSIHFQLYVRTKLPPEIIFANIYDIYSSLAQEEDFVDSPLHEQIIKKMTILRAVFQLYFHIFIDYLKAHTSSDRLFFEEVKAYHDIVSQSCMGLGIHFQIVIGKYCTQHQLTLPWKFKSER